jgi:cytochrome P450
MILTLMRHPEQREALNANLDSVSDAMDECLRFHTHRYLGGFPRFAIEDTVVGGTFIPKNTPIHVSLQSGHYDPERYPDPLTFDIGRRPRGLLAFGVGIHNCMGAHLARMVMRVALRRFLERFPDAHLADQDFVPVYSGGAGARRINHLPMRTN